MIHLDNVTKSFRLRQSNHRILGKLLNVWSRSRRHTALRSVSLSIAPGESVALIGANGSGKSTLLKLIAGVVYPDSGRVDVNGRAAGIIEVGAGFHPDLSGIDNIYLQGAVLGLTRAEIRRRLPDILAFAELGHFINSPVRHYSQGMFLRLGFSIAVFTDPEVFFVDEALAVGDGYFQWKCLERINEFRRQRRTLLFVSHIPNLSESICERAVWIHEGRIRADGPTSEIVQAYNTFLHEHDTQHDFDDFVPEISALVKQTRMGSGGVRIESLRLLNPQGQVCHVFARGQEMLMEIVIDAQRAVRNLAVGLTIERADSSVTIQSSDERGYAFDVRPGRHVILARLPQLPLHAGNFLMTVALQSVENGELVVYDIQVKMNSFTVTEPAERLGFSTRIIELPASVEWSVATT